MDKTERETRDFMNIESFSQLPFIRSAPPVKERGGGGAIRLFGKEFGGRSNDNNNNNNRTIDDNSDDSETNSEATKDGTSSTDNNNNTDNISSRKFECHYCCRNFPTSQALGGHQNAHKRERQLAKRAHLQSAMVHGGLSDPHVYGLLNYNRYGSNPTIPMTYHSWKNGSGSSYGTNTSLYGGYGSYSAHEVQPINGSPLGLWRIPPTHRSSSQVHHQIPVFNSRDDRLKPLSSIGISPSSQRGFGYESKPSMQDQVSLDLHL